MNADQRRSEAEKILTRTEVTALAAKVAPFVTGNMTRDLAHSHEALRAENERLRLHLMRAMPCMMGGTPDLFWPDTYPTEGVEGGPWDQWEVDAFRLLGLRSISHAVCELRKLESLHDLPWPMGAPLRGEPPLKALRAALSVIDEVSDGSD